MGDITVDPKGDAKLLDRLNVLFFSSKFPKRTPWCNDQNLIVPILYIYKKEGGSKYIVFTPGTKKGTVTL